MKNYATEVLLSHPHEGELVYSCNADSKESDAVTKLTEQEQFGRTLYYYSLSNF